MPSPSADGDAAFRRMERHMKATREQAEGERAASAKPK